MKVVLHDRTDGVGQEVRENAERKLARLARHFGKVADAEVDFSEERKRSGLSTIVCRINIHIDGRRTPVLSAHERGADALSALDLALDKIDRQVVKYKEKVTHRKKPLSQVRVSPEDAQDGEARSPEPERIRMKLRPMTVSEAVAELDSDGQAFFVYLDEDSGAIQIVARRADGTVAVIEPIVT